MSPRGFTLIEVLLVIAVIGILASISMFQFAEFSKKSGIESQTRQLYADMMEQRSKALFEKRSRRVKVTASTFSLYSSDVLTGSPMAVSNPKYPIESDNYTDVVFDTGGMLEAVSNQSICVVETNSASVDSIVVSETRIRIGKKKEGTSCVATNINAK